MNRFLLIEEKKFLLNFESKKIATVSKGRKEKFFLSIKYSICIAFTYFIIFLYQNPHQSHIKGYVINKKNQQKKTIIFGNI